MVDGPNVNVALAMCWFSRINYYIIKKTNEEGFDGKYKIILNTSKLGKLLLGKKIGDSFSFGKTIILVIEII